MKTLVWSKLPSVTRTGKSFYRAAPFTVLQSFLTGKWMIDVENVTQQGEYTTAKQAMKAAEKIHNSK